ncbi:PQQ-dependent sugar dehydrogenase [Pedobacter sp. ASV1-7]|jgi:glucose/arabinose dehydrogenase/mono/diheme cytochrome c family protein|uniref:PQQ-dependent sugar dehydrogenase n=1 Tax=Pedobacter sp. ASV1-7 TaxID=3145237 RepID=UPI0032E8FB3D
MKRLLPFLLLIAAFVLNGNVSGVDNQSSVTDSVYLNTKTVISGLNVPWEIQWGPDNWIWFTEQSGTLSKVNPETGERKVLLRLPEVYRYRSLGLLGMAVHPDKSKPYVFLDYTYKNGTVILSKLVRYTYTADTLINPLVLLNDIPGNTGHNGSRITIAPDGKVMMTTGDAVKGANAQNVNSINGKILRINIDGSIPADNPFPGNPVWSMGHRNAQGLTFTKHGHLYSSEHGDAIEDELNLIKKAENYGWPNVEGIIDVEKEKEFIKNIKVTEPAKAWTPVIAPAGISYYGATAIPEWNNSILLVTLKTQSLRVLKLSEDGKAVKSEKIYLDHELGRLRDVCVSPAGDVYVSTSNRDWNPGEGYPKKDDDKIVKVFKVKKPAASKVIVKNEVKPVALPGAVIYNNYCASCHKADGKGIAGVFPPLKGTSRVLGDKNALISVMLKGLSGPIVVKGQKYDQEMPSFNFLSDKDISLVASYIRSQFGNKATAVTAADVKLVRSAKK